MTLYRNFDELADDVLELAKEILPDQLLYLTTIEEDQQMILRLSNNHRRIEIRAGQVFEMEQTLCRHINFEQNEPIWYESVSDDERLEDIQDTLKALQIESYLGIPISLTNGQTFGTLCAVHDEASQFEEKSIQLLQRIAKLFSYYLELEQFAWKDTLTQLYNRRYLTRHWDIEQQHSGALFYLDLDGFKQVNDVYGHETGDQVLIDVAKRLQYCTRAHDDAFSVRIGGDEFLIRFTQQMTRWEYEGIAQQILQQLGTWQTPYAVSTSIGIVLFDDETVELKSIIQQADHALYAAKGAGKNTFRFAEAVSFVVQ
ncbi:sensor domain-containing diguanylate cyclase [uncultured Exiguobacterium sp.]|uniref:sensor domain-containing diguanylate cyclase n=1 Tax=uncultured Exiguobacterium sp. TaxID=202669 RepID=UPI0025F788AC|nr:sensor domain-containing diguanylate cyclase [uncultured Exiguobacterium sp.]